MPPMVRSWGLRVQAVNATPRPVLAQNRRAQARKDLERVLADDADYPGLAEAMAILDAEIKDNGARETEKE
jgi:hypothetical protein